MIVRLVVGIFLLDFVVTNFLVVLNVFIVSLFFFSHCRRFSCCLNVDHGFFLSMLSLISFLSIDVVVGFLL